MASVYPQKQSEFVPWAANYKTKLKATPSRYSVTVAQADENEDLYDAFLLKWNVCQVPATKTTPAVEAKNEALQTLRSNISMLARIINGSPTTTNEMRSELGLPQHAETASPINPPTEKPVMEIVEIDGRIVRINLRTVGTPRRGKPPFVWGANVYSFVGDAPPSDINAWVLEGESTRPDFSVEFPASTPAGSRVFLCACWKSPRLMTGPACNPVEVYLGGGVSQSA